MFKIANLISKLRPAKDKTNPQIPKETDTSVSAITKLLSKYKIAPEFAISGVCIITSVIVCFVLLSPLKSKNIELKSDLSSKAEKLERYSEKGEKIFNDKRIKSKEREITLIKNEINMCKEIMRDRDRAIEKVFEDINGTQIKDEALCKDYYNKKCNELLEFAKRNGFAVTRDSIGFKNWSNKLPTSAEILAEQKRLLVQSDIIKIIVRNRAIIRRFDYLELATQPEPKNKRLSTDLFKVITFKLKLEIEQSKILYLISDILNSGLNFFIELVTLENNKDYEPGELTDAVYTIQIYAYAMDFNNEALQ
ncbi:MAG: hypothetical protein ACUZ8H_02810 [Candidatus Anammoxibacter sp.]